MATLAQIEAARRNGAKSKGPVTPEGKQRSAQNAGRHGLTSRHVLLLANESDDAFRDWVAEMEAKFKPIDEIEWSFIWQAAAARWRIRRAWTIEAGLINQQMQAQYKAMQKQFGEAPVDEAARQASAFKSLADESRSLDLVARYETRLSREYDRAIRGLDRARAERKRNSPATPIPSCEKAEIESETAAEQPVLPDLPNEPKPPAAAAGVEELPNEPKDVAAEHRPGSLDIDDFDHELLDKLLAHPSVRAVLDPPDRERAA